MKKILPVLLIAILIGGFFGFYLYNKPVASTSDLKSDIKLPATELFGVFESDETNAEAKYLDKVVEVTGKIIAVSDESNLTKITLEGGGLDFGVSCELEKKEGSTRTYQTGETVTIKGVCTGKLMDVVLVRCVEVK